MNQGRSRSGKCRCFRMICLPALWLLFLLFSLSVSAQQQEVSDTLLLGEFEVIGERNAYSAVQKVTLKEFSFLPIRDIGDFLRTEPNVSGIRKGGIALDPVVRGFKYNQVSIILNGGVKIEGGCPNRMDPVASHVESEDLAEVEIVRGPYLLKYGPVMGALVNMNPIRPKPGTQPYIHGKFRYGFETNWNGQREHLEISGGTKAFFFRLSGGYKGYGSYTAGNGELFNTSFRKSYINGSAGFVLQKKHQVLLSYSYNQGNDVRFPALPMDERLDQTQVASFQYQGNELGRILKSVQVQGYYSPVHHVMDNFDRPTAATMKAETTVDAWDAGGKVVGEWNAGEASLLTGLDYEYIFKDGEKWMSMKMVMGGDTFTSVKYFNVFNHAVWSNTGLFGEYKRPLGSFDFTAAIRIDFNQAISSDTFRLVKNGVSYFSDLYSSYLNISANTGLKKRLVDGLYLTVAVGMGTRSPSILERFIKLMPVQYDSYDYLGNPQLKPEQNYQADLTLDYTIREIGSFTINGFISAVHNYILGVILPPSVIKPSTQGAPGVKQFSNADLVYLTGFEFRYQSPEEKPWGLSVSAAATYGTNPEAVKYIVSGGQVTGEETLHNDPLPEIPPLEGNVQFLYKFFKAKLVPRLAVRLVSAQNRVSEAYMEKTTPGFITGALSLQYHPCNWFSVTGGVENLMNTPYYEHLNRRIVGSSENFYEPGRVFYINVGISF